MDTAAVCPHCRQQVHLEQGRFRDHFGLSGAWFGKQEVKYSGPMFGPWPDNFIVTRRAN
jgi:hypothetical protein